MHTTRHVTHKLPTNYNKLCFYAVVFSILANFQLRQQLLEELKAEFISYRTNFTRLYQTRFFVLCCKACKLCSSTDNED